VEALLKEKPVAAAPNLQEGEVRGRGEKYAFPYLYNISNQKARDFYGAKDLTAFELKGGKGPIMQCRHCIRYSLGYCVKHGGKRPLWHEPLSLVLGDGRRFRLEFDCQHCQMNVYAEDR
jgi:putative protease